MCATCSIAHVNECIEDMYKGLTAFFSFSVVFLSSLSFLFLLLTSKSVEFVYRGDDNETKPSVSPCIALSPPKEPLIVHYKVG